MQIHDPSRDANFYRAWLSGVQKLCVKALALQLARGADRSPSARYIEIVWSFKKSFESKRAKSSLSKLIKRDPSRKDRLKMDFSA